jgi:hypothetical protein
MAITFSECPLLGVPGNTIDSAGFFGRFAARPTAEPASWPERPVEAHLLGRIYLAGSDRRMGEARECHSIDSRQAPEPDRFQRTNLTRYNALS